MNNLGLDPGNAAWSALQPHHASPLAALATDAPPYPPVSLSTAAPPYPPTPLSAPAGMSNVSLPLSRQPQQASSTSLPPGLTSTASIARQSSASTTSNPSNVHETPPTPWDGRFESASHQKPPPSTQAAVLPHDAHHSPSSQQKRPPQPHTQYEIPLGSLQARSVPTVSTSNGVSAGMPPQASSAVTSDRELPAIPGAYIPSSPPHIPRSSSPDSFVSGADSFASAPDSNLTAQNLTNGVDSKLVRNHGLGASSAKSESLSTRQSMASLTSATSSDAGEGFHSPQRMSRALNPEQLLSFAKEAGYDPADPNLAMYASLHRAAEAANAQENDKELPMPPPRTPSPEPYVDPKLTRLVTHVPRMTHAILRYASSNTGIEEEMLEPEPEPTPAKLGMREALKVVNRRLRSLRTKDQPEAKYAHGLKALVSASQPVFLASLLHYLDVDDVVELRQSCRSIRSALDSALGQELILHRFLGCIGYETWEPQLAVLEAAVQAGPGGAAYLTRLSEGETDPVPLTTCDVLHFALGHVVRAEYQPLAQLVIQNGAEIDPRWPRLAEYTTRAYNRVLARLRAQPHYDPSGSQSEARNGALGSLLAIVRSAVHENKLPEVTLSERAVRAYEQMGMKRYVAEARALETQPLRDAMHVPWRSDRAPVWRAWVPTNNPEGWLEDDELPNVEQQLSLAGIRGNARAQHLLRPGDVVWDVALGGERNVGKLLYDGTFVR